MQNSVLCNLSIVLAGTSMAMIASDRSITQDMLEQRLVLSAQMGDESAVRRFLVRGTNPNAPSCSRRPLVEASRYGHLGVVNVLMGAGANLEASGQSGLSKPITEATWAGHTAVVSALLDNGARIELSTGFRHTVLRWAALKQNNEMVYMMLQNRSMMRAEDLAQLRDDQVNDRDPFFRLQCKEAADCIEEMTRRDTMTRTVGERALRFSQYLLPELAKLSLEYVSLKEETPEEQKRTYDLVDHSIKRGPRKAGRGMVLSPQKQIVLTR